MVRSDFGKYFRRTPDGSSYDLVERTLEPAMFVLGVLFIPVVLGPWLADMSDESKAAFEALGWAIWLAFVVEYGWRFYLAPRRVQMGRNHKLDLVIILFPLLRPLRVVRVVRLVTAASGMGRAVAAGRRIGARPGFQPFFMTVAMLMIVGIAGLSMLTASIAALFVQEDDEPGIDELRAQLDRIEALLAAQR